MRPARPAAAIRITLLTATLGCSLKPYDPGEATASTSSSSSQGDSTTGDGTTADPSTTTTGPIDITGDTTSISLPNQKCDFHSQDCPPGEKCVAHSPDEFVWTTFECIPVVDSPGKPGDPCTVTDHWSSGHDTCDKGSTCWHLNGDLVGHCMTNCSWDLVCPEATQYCRMLADTEFSPLLCFQSCDPLAQDCPGDEVCTFDEYWRTTFNCYPETGVVGTQPFDTCAPFAHGLCAKGLACPWDAPGCLPFCDLSAPICPDTLQCLPWYPMGEAPPEYENVGVCSP